MINDPEYIEAPELVPQSEALAKLINMVNIAESLDDDKLDNIGRRCVDGYEIDEKSREEWIKGAREAMKLANQDREQKSFPWTGAANIKMPTITDAAIKFQARAYPELIPHGGIVKVLPVGADADLSKSQRAQRVASFMSWQLSEKEVEFEPDMDKLLLMLPIVGHMFRRRYWCAPESRTKSETCMPEDVCVNQGISCLEDAPRITYIRRNVRKNEIVSNQRGGIWREVELEEEPVADSEAEKQFFTIIEQQCYLDLDDDGYEEPYLVTVDKDTQKVLRIVANYDDSMITMNDDGQVVYIEPIRIYTDYVFIPALDGSYYGMGFGQMLEPLTRVANTLVNQLTDAGSLANMQSGYLSRDIKIKSGRQRFELGEWKRTEATSEQLAKGVFPLPTKEPSPTLFNLLGMMLEMTDKLSSVQDVLAGDAPSGNMPATTVMALIEQGMKTFNSIYKRIYRSLQKEFKQLYRLNAMYLDEQEYFNVLDQEQAISKADFDMNDLDVRPVAEPTITSDMARISRAEALRSLIGSPGIDPRPIMNEWFSAMKVPQYQVDQIMPPEPQQQGVDPQMMAMMQEVEMKQADVANKERELEIKEREVALKERELEIKAYEAVAKSMERIASAEAKQAGSQIGAYKTFSDIILKEVQQELNAQKIDSGSQPMINSTQEQQPIEGVNVDIQR